MVDRAGRSELHYAALNDEVAEIERLIAEGQSPDQADSAGYTPLHFAAQEVNPAAIRALLDAGAHVDPQDRNGNTPFSNATFYGGDDGSCIQLLLASGADMHLVNNYGQTPLGLAELITTYDVRRLYPADATSTQGAARGPE